MQQLMLLHSSPDYIYDCKQGRGGTAGLNSLLRIAPPVRRSGQPLERASPDRRKAPKQMSIAGSGVRRSQRCAGAGLRVGPDRADPDGWSRRPGGGHKGPDFRLEAGGGRARTEGLPTRKAGRERGLWVGAVCRRGPPSRRCDSDSGGGGLRWPGPARISSG